MKRGALSVMVKTAYRGSFGGQPIDVGPLSLISVSEWILPCAQRCAQICKESGVPEEFEALAKARAVISEMTGGAESFNCSLTQTSVLQLSQSVLLSRGGLAKVEAARKKLENLRRARIRSCWRSSHLVLLGVFFETGTADSLCV